jgi:hypothetical protein
MKTIDYKHSNFEFSKLLNTLARGQGQFAVFCDTAADPHIRKSADASAAHFSDFFVLI